MWWVADAGSIESRQGRIARSEESEGGESWGGFGVGRADGSGLADATSSGCARSESERWEKGEEPDRGGSWLGDTSGERLSPPQRKAVFGEGRGIEGGAAAESGGAPSYWDGIFIPCADGKARRLEPSIEPLAHGVSNRVGRLRAYGNAIVPQVAAEVLKAWRL
jgi:DNA (cytosine-5)-methyltransferase 1